MVKKLVAFASAASVVFGAAAAQAATFDFNFYAPIQGSTDVYLGDGQLFGIEDGLGGFTISGATGVLRIQDYDDFSSVIEEGTGFIRPADYGFQATNLLLRTGGGGPDIAFIPRFGIQYAIRIGEVGTPSGSLTILPSETAAVPEPATWAMMIAGFGMIGASARYRRRGNKVRFA